MNFFKFLLPAFIIFSFSISSCKKDKPIELVPVARFTTPIIEFGEVTFRNHSFNASEYFWDFDDGNTSTEREPIHEYSTLGVYRVKLTASDGVNSDTYTMIVAIGQVFPSNLFKLDNLPFGGSAEMISFTKNGKGYVGGGNQGGSFELSKNLWEFDPISKEWILKTIDMPAEYVGGVSFEIEDDVYMGLGTGSDFNGSFIFSKYSVSDNSFSPSTSFPFSTSIEGRVLDAAHFSYGGKGYVIGQGQFQYNSGNSGEKKIYEYDPDNLTWTPIGDYPMEGNSGMMYFLLGEKLYIGMGNANSFSSFSNKRDIWEYNLVTKTWVQKNDFPGDPRRDGIGFTYDGYGYLGFGLSADLNTGIQIHLSDLWKYDHNNDTWEKVADFPIASKYELFAFVFGNSLFFGGGYNAGGTPVNEFYEYQF